MLPAVCICADLRELTCFVSKKQNVLSQQPKLIKEDVYLNTSRDCVRRRPLNVNNEIKAGYRVYVTRMDCRAIRPEPGL